MLPCLGANLENPSAKVFSKTLSAGKHSWKEKGGGTLEDSKLVSLPEAIQEIHNGDVLFLGGFIDSRRPMAAAYEIVRQKKKD